MRCFFTYLTLILTSFYVFPQSTQSLFQQQEQEQESADENGQSTQYLHQGRLDRIKQEECAKDKSLFGCDLGALRAIDISQNRQQVAQLVSSAYTTVGPKLKISSNGSLFGPKAVKNAATDAKAPDEQVNDFCSHIPTIGNQVSQDTEQSKTEQLQSQGSSLSSPQSDALYQAAKTHQNSAKSSQQLGRTWNATSFCYTAHIANGGFADPKVYAKAGAAIVVADFYRDKNQVHEQYEERLNNLGNFINSKNDCSPVTNTNCFCNLEPTSAQFDPEAYNQYCLPPALASRGFNGVSCVNDRGQVDRNCDCATNGNCFDSSFNTALQNSQQLFHPNATGELSNAVRALSNGNSEQLTSTQSEALFNAALRTLRQADGNVTIDPGTARRAKPEDIAFFESRGLPRNTSVLLASQPPAPSGTRQLFAEQTKAFNAKETLKKFDKVQRSQLRYSQAFKRSAPKRKRKKKKRRNLLAKFQNGTTKGGVSILGWEQKALNKADISVDNSKPIFEIISNRYKFSGWEKVKYDFLK